VTPEDSDEEEWEEEEEEEEEEDEWEDEDEDEDDEEEWEDEEDEEDEEDDEDDEPRSRRRSRGGGGGRGFGGWSLRGDPIGRGLALGFLSMLPLLIAYEVSIAGRSGGGARSVAEAILTTPLEHHGQATVDFARRSTLAGLTALAFFAYLIAHRHDESGGLGPRLVRVWVEGIAGAVILGPILLLAARAAEPYVGAMIVGAPEGPVPTLSRAGFVMGGAAYEEIVFRIGGLSVIWLVAKHFLIWFGAGDRLAAWGAIALACVGSAVLFAAFHLGALTGWLGPGGEAFDAAVFTWRTTAGILLAILFFWRGVGVGAWTHAVFNLSILIGAGPSSIS